MIRRLPRPLLQIIITVFSIVLLNPVFADNNNGHNSSEAELKQRLVTNIIFEGNDKTQEETLLQELTFGIGDLVNKEDLKVSRQSILNLGLFTEADVAFRSETENIIVIKIKEKRFNFILPRLSRNGDGDITVGASWRSDNLNGLNQSSKLTAAYRDFQSTEEDNAVFAEWEFDYPRIINTHYSFNSDLSFENTSLDETIDGETGTYTRDRSSIRFEIGEWAFKSGPSRGLRLSGGWLWEDFKHNYISGTQGLLPNRRINALILGAKGFFTRDLILSRAGIDYGLTMTMGDNTIGSEIDFTLTEGYYRRYHQVSNTPHTNLNYQIAFAHISRPLLGPPQFEAAGSSRLRGYDRDDLEGNAYLVFNTEYLRPVNDKKTVRVAALFDAGNAWTYDRDIDLLDLRYTIGFGLRWKITKFVKTDLRIDVAHGLSDDGKTRLYLSTSSTF